MNLIPQIVYVLCGAASFTCMALLARHYRETKICLLFWSSLAFLAFAVSNVLLFVDFVVIGPAYDLSLWRAIPTLVGVMLLLYGLIRTGTEI
jgi:drug/metabolite transporter (DMT)-like permease